MLKSKISTWKVWKWQKNSQKWQCSFLRIYFTALVCDKNKLSIIQSVVYRNSNHILLFLINVCNETLCARSLIWIVFNFVDVLVRTFIGQQCHNFKWIRVKKRKRKWGGKGKRKRHSKLEKKSRVWFSVLQPMSLCDYCLVAYLSSPRIEMSIQTQFSEWFKWN